MTLFQISEFLSGRAPLVLAMRLGDHMMFIQLQLSTQTGAKRARPSSVQLPTPKNMTVHDHQEVPSPTYIPHAGSNGFPYNLHQFRSFPESEKVRHYTNKVKNYAQSDMSFVCLCRRYLQPKVHFGLQRAFSSLSAGQENILGQISYCTHYAISHEGRNEDDPLLKNNTAW